MKQRKTLRILIVFGSRALVNASYIKLKVSNHLEDSVDTEECSQCFQKNHSMLLVTPMKATFVECTEVSQVFSDQGADTQKFSADLYNLMTGTSGIAVRKKVQSVLKENVYILSELLISGFYDYTPYVAKPPHITASQPNIYGGTMSSLNTLLEAARFLELQEQQQQNRATVAEALAAMKPVSPIMMPSSPTSPTHTVTPTFANLKTVTANTSPQTVVISSSNIAPTIIQGPITFTTSPPTQYLKKIDQDGQVSSTTVVPSQLPRQRILHNSFDIRNPLIIDETNGNESKRKQPPMVFRAGTREVHNKLEKHRRAHLKECFDILKKQLPSAQDEKKTSNLSILHSALRYIQSLKRKERELEHEMEMLARDKIVAQQRLAGLKKDISSHYDNIDFSKLLPEIIASSPSTSSATETVIDTRNELVNTNMSLQNGTIHDKVNIPILAKTNIPIVTQNLTLKEISQPVQTTALSVLPMSYPVNQGLVLQKVAIVPKGLDGLTPLVSTHFITTPQQINGKVVPLTQYLVKPVVVVSTASPRPS
ncbi:hypothetical protein JTB14_019971 [Gonioctena quinquepunctata]|nr:hypothetical protein JTB14_019971 [Gonioctena quinquepunctata]